MAKALAKAPKNSIIVVGTNVDPQERPRGPGVTCTACLDGPFYHKLHDRGMGAISTKLPWGNLPAWGNHATCAEQWMMTPLKTQCPREPGGEQTPHERGRGKCRPLSEYVRFETEQGAMLLYEPSALDKWIGMCLRQDSRNRGVCQPRNGEGQ